MTPRVEAKKDERGRWCVFIDGKFVSDHRDHVGARRAAQAHVAIINDETDFP